jgi:hypothetical protein
MRKPDGETPKELVDNFGQLARWSARFRLAKSFKSLDLGDAYSGSDTPQLYSAITRIFLVYSAFEIYCDIICFKSSKESQIKALQDALSQQATIKTIRDLDPQNAFATFLLQHLTGVKLKRTMCDFIGNEKEINVSCLAKSIRHVFAHGILTANAMGLSPKRFDQVSQIISDFLLNCMDKDFDERIPANLD